jgi:hypothetical protein
MPFFDKKRDNAKYVLISFSRNLTALRLDSSIAHSNPASLQDLNAAEKHENHNNSEHQAYATRRKVAPVTAVRPTWSSAYECQDQKHDQDCSKHCFFSFRNSAG